MVPGASASGLAEAKEARLSPDISAQSAHVQPALRMHTVIAVAAPDATQEALREPSSVYKNHFFHMHKSVCKVYPMQMHAHIITPERRRVRDSRWLGRRRA
jgi:hypothetical protein